MLFSISLSFWKIFPNSLPVTSVFAAIRLSAFDFAADEAAFSEVEGADDVVFVVVFFTTVTQDGDLWSSG